MADDKSELNDAEGEPEVISGIAENAKAGAVLVASDGSPTYVEGLSEWPENFLNKRVTLTGVVQRQSIFPPVQEVEGGEIQGMVGIPRVITLTEPLPEAD